MFGLAVVRNKSVEKRESETASNPAKFTGNDLNVYRNKRPSSILLGFDVSDVILRIFGFLEGISLWFTELFDTAHNREYSIRIDGKHHKRALLGDRGLSKRRKRLCTPLCQVIFWK